MADWSLSSQTDEVFRQPFREYRFCYADILSKKRFAFLQHGVFTNDLSKWLNRFRQQFDGFVISTHNELKHLQSGNYHYADKEIWLTGLPRFDYRSDRREKTITVLPTWRRYLGKREDLETGFWVLRPGFENSRYVSEYRSLMQDKRLRSAAQKYGYTLQFKLHPAFENAADKFDFDPNVKVISNHVM